MKFPKITFFALIFVSSVAWASTAPTEAEVDDDGGFSQPYYYEGNSSLFMDFLENAPAYGNNVFGWWTGFLKKVCAVKTASCDPVARAEDIRIEVNLNDNKPGQYLEVLASGQLLWRSQISTGVAGHRTPKGSFALSIHNGGRLYSTRNHCSSVADWGSVKNGVVYLAPMPYSVHFNGGVALHAGKVTGKPESHGCVRQHVEDARKLYCFLVSEENWKRTVVTVK